MGWVFKTTNHPLYPRETRRPLYRRLGGPQGRSGRVRKISPPPRCIPWTIQPVASRYSDCLKYYVFLISHYVTVVRLNISFWVLQELILYKPHIRIQFASRSKYTVSQLQRSAVYIRKNNFYLFFLNCCLSVHVDNYTIIIPTKCTRFLLLKAQDITICTFCLCILSPYMFQPAWVIFRGAMPVPS
jgi:hypothetical protein